MKRKLLSLVLCAATALGSVALLASCSEKDPGKTTTDGGAIEQDEHFLNKLPADLNFANEGLTDDELIVYVAYVEGANGDFTRRSLKADELDESTVDIKTMERDNRMKAQLGIELEIEQTGTGIGDMEGQIGSALLAGTSDFDVLAGYQYFGIGMAAKGYLLNLADLDSVDADYIDMDAPYWGKSFNDNMSYKGAYYWITGDIALRYIGGMYCTFVNSTIYSNKLEAEYGSIYTIARDGDWTIDLMTTMASQCYDDNGTTAGEPDADDTFGFGWEPTDMIDGIAIGCGVQFTFKDPDTGDVMLTFANQHSYDISDKINALATNKAFAYQYPDGDSANVMQAFGNGTVAFTVNKLFQAEAYLEEFDEFYIIPAPKFDENQENYITGIHDGCTIFGITYCTPKVRQAAAALEFLCAYSSKDVRPQYYDGVMKGQYARDPEAAEMIDLIHSNITTDFALAYGNSLNSIGWIYRTAGKITNSTINRDRKTWETSLASLITNLEKYVNGGVPGEDTAE